MKACNQCGKCCENYSDGGLVATLDEIKYWQSYYPEVAAFVHNGEIWFDPKSNQQLSRCPWLQKSKQEESDLKDDKIDQSKQPQHDRVKYSCRIYAYRPADCRQYPVSIQQMKNDNCEMLEPSDLKRPKMAQRRLDNIMAESRCWSIEWLETP